MYLPKRELYKDGKYEVIRWYSPLNEVLVTYDPSNDTMRLYETKYILDSGKTRTLKPADYGIKDRINCFCFSTNQKILVIASKNKIAILKIGNIDEFFYNKPITIVAQFNIRYNNIKNMYMNKNHELVIITKFDSIYHSVEGGRALSEYI